MIDIELRVLEKKSVGCDVHGIDNPPERILQQRTKTKFVDSGNVGGSHYDWDEWENIPIVKEEDL